MRQYKKPMFQKRHYEAIGRILRRHLQNIRDANMEKTSELHSIITIKAVMADLSNLFLTDNPNYDTLRFLDFVGFNDIQDVSLEDTITNLVNTN